MAKSRQQLINASSFLSDQKEKIGGLNVKRSTITADSFKKGSSQESVDNIKNRVAENEKKITLLKNIIKLRKENVDKQLKLVDTPQQMGSPLLESLQSIASTVDSIRDTLIKQQDNDKRTAEDLRREKEEDERKGQEKGLESSKPNILQKVGDTVMKPVMGLFGKIFNFLKTLFLGKILMNFIDWFSNPANQGKIQTLVRFVKDWWPALTAAVLLFGTGFGGLVAGLIKTILFFIPAMTKAIVALKSAKFMSMIPGVGKIGKVLKVAAPLALAGGVGYGIGRMQGGDDQQEPLQMNKGGTVPGSGNKDTVPAMLTPGEFVMSKGAVQEYGVDHLEGMNAAAGGTNIPTLKKVEVPHYEGGGPVIGYGMGEIMPDQFVFNKTEFNSKSTTRTRNGEVIDHKREKSFTDIGGAIGMPDLIENQTQLVESLRKVAGYEDINFMDVVQYPDGQGRLVGMPEETLYPILNASDAAKATSAKQSEADRRFMEDNDLIKPDGSVKGYSYFGGKLKVDGEEDRDAVLADGAIREFNGGGLVPNFMGGGIVNNAATQSMGMEGGVFNNMFNNTLGYQGGGEVKGMNSYSDEFLAEEKQFQSYKDRRLVSEATETKGAVHKVYDDNGKYVGTTYGPSLTEQARFNRMEGRNNLNRKKKKGGGLFGGLKRVVGGTADQLTGNLFDFDKKSGGGLVRKTAGAVGGLFGGGKKEGGTKGSSGILGPISSNVDAMVNTDKYEVKPKEKKNTVVAYQQAVNEQQQQDQEASSDGNEIPNFSIRPSFMIDEAKVDVLGIMV